MPSAALRQLVDRVLGKRVEDIDLKLVGLLSVDPERALEEFKLEPSERDALLARDVEALMRLGLREEAATGVLSGQSFHSPQCPTIVIDAGWWREGK